MLFGLNGLGQRCHYFFGDHTGIPWFSNILKDKDKLIPPQPGHGVGLTALPLQPLGYLLEQVIADIMPQSIVDGFKFVQIEKEDSHPRPMPVRFTHRLVESIAKEQPVGQAGQAVMMGQLVEMGAGLA
jgi:hypothetical protein